MSLNIPPRMSLKGYTAYTEAQDFQDLYLHNSSTRHTSFPFFFHLFLYLFLHAITSRQCLMIILYFILFVYFSKATHQTSNQGNKTSPLAFAPLRNCVPIAQILFIYLFILFLFFHYQIYLPLQSLYPFIISYSQQPTYFSSFNDQHVKPILQKKKLFIFFNDHTFLLHLLKSDFLQ